MLTNGGSVGLGYGVENGNFGLFKMCTRGSNFSFVNLYSYISNAYSKFDYTSEW